MGALSRLVNDDYKKSTDLAVTVIQIFHWCVVTVMNAVSACHVCTRMYACM
jgi:hypothetical protein